VAINIFGFVPAGFFFLAWFRNRESPLAIPPAAYSILICGSISLAIELMQVHLPTRDSSALDLACNVMGSVIGVFATKKRGEA
jgi:glycopeptide antibiotics resistance protein